MRSKERKRKNMFGKGLANPEEATINDLFRSSNGHLLLTVHNYTLFYGILTQLFIYN